METPKHKPHTNIGIFLTPGQKDHVDKIIEFLKTDNLTVSQQIQKLEVEKAELLEALEKLLYGNFFNNVERQDFIESLIQKHKK